MRELIAGRLSWQRYWFRSLESAWLTWQEKTVEF